MQIENKKKKQKTINTFISERDEILDSQVWESLLTNSINDKIYMGIKIVCVNKDYANTYLTQN